uniref:Rhabdomeric opsin n=1 Tax=Nautilus pompilius TaxID=34573 RepID=A0A0H5B8K8_9MOLL|nr:rhabdomeric opsin [Nautilus pompilius]
MATAQAITTIDPENITSVWDNEDVFIHPHWKHFPGVPDAAHYIVGIFITVVGICGVMGNGVVIYIFSRTKSLRTPANMFIINLALSDLTFSAVNGFPLLSISSFQKKWIFGQTACELYGLAGGIFGLMSINTMAMISIDRYNVIARPMAVSKRMSHKKAFIMIISVWIWAAVWTLPPLFGWGAYIPEGFQTSCTFDYLTRNNYFRSYVLCLYLFGFITPVTIIAICYFFIFKAVADHEKEMAKMAKKMNAKEIRAGASEQRAEMKIAKISMIIITQFLLSWTPYAVVAMLGQFGPPEWVTPYASEVPVMFAKASAMHNPIVYALSHPKFREAINERFPFLISCCAFDEKETAEPEESKTDDMRDESSTMSNISDGGQVEMSTRGRRGGADTRYNDRGDMGVSNGEIIRDLLNAFVNVVGAQKPQQPSTVSVAMPTIPTYLPPMYPSHGYYPPPPAHYPEDANRPSPYPAVRPDVYAISHGPLATYDQQVAGGPAAAPKPAETAKDQAAEVERIKKLALEREQVYLPANKTAEGAANEDLPPPPSQNTAADKPQEENQDEKKGIDNKAFEK